MMIEIIQNIILSLLMGMMIWTMLTVWQIKNEIHSLGLVHIEFGGDYEDED